MIDDLKFSGDAPVVITYNGSSDDVYAPVRTSAADINIVSPNILDDLYTAKKDSIIVKIEKNEYERGLVAEITNPGNIESLYDSDGYKPYMYKIYQKDQIFEDINGKLNFIGILEGEEGRFPVAVTYAYLWTEDEYFWNMEETGRYFHDGQYSYMVTYESGRHYVSEYEPIGHNWVNKNYYMIRYGSSYSDCDISVDHIAHLVNGSLEMVVGYNRYLFEKVMPQNDRMGWNKVNRYTFSEGEHYLDIDTAWYHQVRINGVLTDAICVSGYGGVGSTTNCIATMNSTTGTLTRILDLKQGWSNENVLSVDGNLYYMTTDGVLWSWNWDVNDWVEWVTFTGDINPGSVYLDYIIHERYRRVAVFRFDKSNGKREAFGITNLVPPNAMMVEKRIGPPVRKTIWEGYKMPNTYSQEVSLNLDAIEMTCIDPISILKFITVDKILDKPNVMTYGQLIGKALAYVKISANTLWVDRTVSYGGSYNGTNGLLNLSIQVANFWDESGKASTVYEMIEEMLRPFCLTLVYYNNSYQIYNVNKLTGTRHFDIYTIGDTGILALTTSDVQEVKDSGLYRFANGDWKSNNTQMPTIEIGSTYDKVTGVASTSKPDYSDMVFDHISYTQRDKYDYEDLNVQRNKTKGYTKRNNMVVEDSSDYWYYIWNGVYCDAKYNLTDAGGYTNWYDNCNKALYYLNSSTGNPDNWGAVLNFYGGTTNPSATGKSQSTEKSVKVFKKITAYAKDNGVPVEFLENSDLEWVGEVSGGELVLQKQNSSNLKFGTGVPMGDSDRVVYHQVYDNINLDSTNDMTLNLDISRSFSRTGINLNFDELNFNTATDVEYNLGGNLKRCRTKYCPQPWNSSEVVVNSIYFRRYTSGSTIRVTQVWDERRIDMYVVKSDSTILQFNGKEWVTVSSPSASNSFRLKKLMNNEHLFLTEHRYNVIETSNGENFSLADEPFTFYTDHNGGVYPEGDSGTEHTYQSYHLGNNYWQENVFSSSDGQMSIILPKIDDTNATVYVDVYNSTMLGMTGCDDIGRAPTGNPFYYGLGGGEWTGPVFIDFLPKNLSHVKAEHLSLDINISVPDSNLGQVFKESDVKYQLVADEDYVEEFEGPTFLVNSYNALVNSSFSYLIFNNAIADPSEFRIASRTGRPESFVVQAYFNWLSKIRKIYTKTLIPYQNYVRTRPFNNVRCYLKSPEVSDNELLVVRDIWDVKTNRHSITAIEDQDMEVTTVDTVDIFEIPRKARADRYNLPTAAKK